MSKKHVWYVVLAEFDLIEGSVIRRQHPEPTGAADNFLAEAMLPEGSHSRSEDETVFMLPKIIIEGKSGGKAAGENEKAPRPVLHCLSCFLAKKDDKVKRGSVTKALAVCSPHTFIHAFRPVIRLALKELFSPISKADPKAHELRIVQELYDTLNGLTLPSAYPLPPIHESLYRAARLREAHNRPFQDLDLKITWRSRDISTRVPAIVGEDEIGQVKLINLLKRFKTGFMKIFNAILLERRVLFIGHNLPASEVCQHVLAACLMVSPPLSGVKERVFPYTSISNLEKLLATKGYIAGVTNPIFSQRSSWWDVCCDLNDGKILVSAEYQKALDTCGEPEGPEGGPQKGDQASPTSGGFDRVDVLDAEFSAEVRVGLEMGRGDTWAREMISGYVERIVDLAFGDAASAADTACMAENMPRILLLKNTTQFRLHANRRGVSKSSGPCGRATMLLSRHVKTLQHGTPSERELDGILDYMVQTLDCQEKLVQLLTLLPEAKGGLYPIALCLFHEKRSVQDKATRLLRKFDDFKEGSLWLSALNFFLLRTYMRCKARQDREMESKKLTQETKKSTVDPVDRKTPPVDPQAKQEEAGKELRPDEATEDKPRARTSRTGRIRRASLGSTVV